MLIEPLIRQKPYLETNAAVRYSKIMFILSKILKRFMSSSWSTHAKSNQNKVTRPWYKNEITRITYQEFLPKLSNESINERIIKYAYSMTQAESHSITKEMLLKSFLKIPSVRLEDLSPVDHNKKRYNILTNNLTSKNLTDIQMRDIGKINYRKIPDEAFGNIFGETCGNLLRNSRRENLKRMFIIPCSNNELKITYDPNINKEARISTAVSSDILNPVFKCLVVTGNEAIVLEEEQVLTPFGNNICQPDFLIMCNNRKLPIEVKRPINTTTEFPPNLVKIVILYMLSLNSEVGVISTYFETYIFHISKTDVESSKKTKDAKISLTVGMRKIKNTDQFITPVLAIFTLMLKKKRFLSSSKFGQIVSKIKERD